MFSLAPSHPPLPHPPRHLSFGTFNIRYDGTAGRPLHFQSPRAPQMKAKGWGERPWRERREKVADAVLWEELDVVGFQEALENQVEDLAELLGEGYAHVGVGRYDGIKAGEFVPIFYRRDRLQLLSVEHFWLSKTPDIPGSISWDAGQTRMVTLVHFRSLFLPSSSPDPDFFVLNTHFDDRGLLSRTESAKLILHRLASLLAHEGATKLVVLLGDLNFPSWEEGYQILTGARYAPLSVERPKGPSFVDTRHELELASRANEGGLLHSPFGDLHTFTGFARTDTPVIIDVVLLGDNGALKSGGGKGWRSVGLGSCRISTRMECSFRTDHRLVVARL